jgi:two-component system, chemotaxis family, protein-glutamate methylesterase/glutaminase
MPGHDIIVIGASAGGVEALTNLVSRLPSDIPAALFVVLHFPSRATSALPDILSRKGPLRARHARDHEPIQPGRIYVAPPDNHLLLRNGFVRVVAGPRENGHRPAIDPLFRSAARAYGTQTIGVILSGVLDDGTAGLVAIKSRGGIAVVQEPTDALYSGMPEIALQHLDVDHVLPAAELGSLLGRLALEPAPQGDTEVPNEMQMETEISEFALDALQSVQRPGSPAGFGCPDCGGALWDLEEEGMVRFRCRVGHGWSADSLIAEQNVALESALWTALRALEERAALSQRMLEHAEKGQRATALGRYRDQLVEARQAAGLIREVLLASAQKQAPDEADAVGQVA